MKPQEHRPRRRGRPPKDRRLHLFVAATIDYRGEQDDQLTFVFRGASQQLLEQVFRHLIGRGYGIAREAVVREETDIVRRDGKGYYRVAVRLTTPNYDFCSLNDMQLLIEATMKRLHPCTLHWMTLGRFLNV